MNTRSDIFELELCTFKSDFQPRKLSKSFFARIFIFKRLCEYNFSKNFGGITMYKGKFFRRTLLTLLTVSIIIFASVTHAEIYTGEGSYIMSKAETLEVARERAKADAMRNAAEKAGTYVKSYSRSRNFELEEDIIETMTANILKLIGNPNFLPYEQLDNLEGLLIRVIVNVQIDDSDINRWLKKDEQQKSELVSQNEALRKANEEQARQIAELKRQLANNPNDREQITKKLEVEDKIFLSNQKIEEATRLREQGKYEDAIKLCNEAIELNPNNYLAYLRRGNFYYRQKQYERAIQDFDKAIQLNPNYSIAYNNRGLSYSDLKKYEIAIQDYNKAIQINSNYALAYYNRGTSYVYLKKYDLAIKDYSKAIQINPKYAEAYNNRGAVYVDGLKQYEPARLSTTIKLFNSIRII